MTRQMPAIGVVGSAAGGLETLTDELVVPLRGRGYRVAVTLTPTARTWLDHSGDHGRLTDLTGHPVRSEPRLPTEERPHPPIDLYIAAPLSANSTAKLALGIGDNQAMTVLCESIGTIPMIIFPRVNAGHARQPAWSDHLERLRSVPTVCLISGEPVWPLYEPDAEPDRSLPWQVILSEVERMLSWSRS